MAVICYIFSLAGHALMESVWQSESAFHTGSRLSFCPSAWFYLQFAHYKNCSLPCAVLCVWNALPCISHDSTVKHQSLFQNGPCLSSLQSALLLTPLSWQSLMWFVSLAYVPFRKSYNFKMQFGVVLFTVKYFESISKPKQHFTMWVNLGYWPFTCWRTARLSLAPLPLFFFFFNHLHAKTNFRYVNGEHKLWSCQSTYLGGDLLCFMVNVCFIFF